MVDIKPQAGAGFQRHDASGEALGDTCFHVCAFPPKLPNNLRHDLDMSRAAGTPDPMSSTISPGLSFAKAVGFPNLTKPEAPKSGSALSVGSSGGKHRLRDQIPRCWLVASPSSISLRTLGPSCSYRVGRSLGD
jgi:hypothetical protein